MKFSMCGKVSKTLPTKDKERKMYLSQLYVVVSIKWIVRQVCRILCHEDDSFVQKEFVSLIVHINIGLQDGGTHSCIQIDMQLI